MTYLISGLGGADLSGNFLLPAGVLQSPDNVTISCAVASLTVTGQAATVRLSKIVSAVAASLEVLALVASVVFTGGAGTSWYRADRLRRLIKWTLGMGVN